MKTLKKYRVSGTFMFQTPKNSKNKLRRTIIGGVEYSIIDVPATIHAYSKKEAIDTVVKIRKSVFPNIPTKSRLSAVELDY